MRYAAAMAAMALVVAGCDRPNTSTTTGDTMAVAADTGAPAIPAATGDEAKIADAMSAAPDSISSNATIMDWPATAGGQMRQLRAGTSSWVCYPSTPPAAGASGDDPMCLDPVFQQWAQAWMGKTNPNLKGVGFAYMLKGDRGVSNTDPFATDSTATNSWIRSGPHVMFVAPSAATLASVGSTPGASPYVMFKGTPYAHVMISVK